MQENNENKKCLYCCNYEGYYVKGLHHFESIKKGYCLKQDKIVNYNFGCECWKTNRRKFYLRKKAATRALYEILTDISAIRQIIQESQEEGNNP